MFAFISIFFDIFVILSCTLIFFFLFIILNKDKVNSSNLTTRFINFLFIGNFINWFFFFLFFFKVIDYFQNALIFVSFNNFFIIDKLSSVIELILIILFWISLNVWIFFCKKSFSLSFESYIFFLLLLYTALMIIHLTDFMDFYLYLESQTFLTLGLISQTRQIAGEPASSSLNIEGLLKYYIVMSLGSGLLIYGISLIYGITGSVLFNDIANYIDIHGNIYGILPAILFILIGCACKLGVAPFHNWIADVYEAIPIPVTILVSGVLKISIFIFLTRFFFTVIINTVLEEVWFFTCFTLSIFSICLGTFSTFDLYRVKRMSAATTVMSNGYIFLFLAIPSEISFAFILYYLVLSSLVSFWAFGTQMLMSYKDEYHKFLDIIYFSNFTAFSKWSFVRVFLLMFFQLIFSGFPPSAMFLIKYVLWQIFLVNIFGLIFFFLLIFAILLFYVAIRIIRYATFDIFTLLDIQNLNVSRDRFDTKSYTISLNFSLVFIVLTIFLPFLELLFFPNIIQALFFF